MQNSASASQDTDLRIQYSLVARIKAAGNVYKSAPASHTAEPLRCYLTALENLAEYVATRCRGAELSNEAAVPGDKQAMAPAKPRKRSPKLIEFTPPAEEPITFTAGDAPRESLAC